MSDSTTELQIPHGTSMERVADHAGSIARNIIYSVTGEDVRHVNLVKFEQA